MKGTLRRAKEMRNLSPLTGLPGNIRIQEEIERQVREHRPFAVLYFDLDNFKAYNDQNGFVRGDRLIQATARIIQDAVVEYDARTGSSATSAGTTSWRSCSRTSPRRSPKIVCERFDEERSRVLRAGGSRPRLRRGSRTARVSCRTSRSSASRSASPPPRCAAFAHYGEAVSVATEMKQFAKRDVGSCYAVDRRAP